MQQRGPSLHQKAGAALSTLLIAFEEVRVLGTVGALEKHLPKGMAQRGVSGNVLQSEAATAKHYRTASPSVQTHPRVRSPGDMGIFLLVEWSPKVV